MWRREPPVPTPRVGETFGPFELEEVLGEGGMGTVFRAVRMPGGDVCALKILRQEISSDPVHRKRFAHEARAASEVQHRHLVPILDAGEIQGVHYIAERFVAGRTLLQRIRDDGPLPLDEICGVVADVGSGLDALHKNGLVHRDVKPSNIILDSRGGALLTDFGLARGRAYTVLTKAGQVMGTLDYLAPELIRGDQATPRSDIYALGCVAYETITGKPPFAHKSAIQVGVAHLEEEPPEPLVARPELPASFGWAVLRALVKDPNERPPTATMYANLLSIAAKEATR